MWAITVANLVAANGERALVSGARSPAALIGVPGQEPAVSDAPSDERQRKFGSNVAAPVSHEHLVAVWRGLVLDGMRLVRGLAACAARFVSAASGDAK
jgi:hypothetical protein